MEGKGTGARTGSALWIRMALLAVGVPLLILCQLHLSGEFFVLKGSRFFGEVAFGSRALARFTAYGGILLLPLLLHFCRRLELPEVRWPIALLLAVVSSACAFPYLFIDFTAPLPPARVLVEHCLRYGLTAPLAFVSVTLAVGSALPSLDPKRSLLWCLAIFGGLLLVGPLWRGVPYPRLEDEVAYHLQALIFQSGRFSAELALPDFARSQTPIELLPITWLDFSGSRFWSSHFHGWSALLAALSLIKLAPYAALLCALAGMLVFVRLSRSVLPNLPLRENADADAADQVSGRGVSTGQLVAVAAFGSIALLPALAQSYMAHLFALLLSLGSCLLWVSLEPDDGTKPVRRRWLTAVGLCIVAMLYALTRLQSLGALFSAFVLADLLPASASSVPFRKRLPRVVTVLAAAACAVGATYLYRFVSGTSYVTAACQAIGFGPGHGCFPTYGTLGHSFTKTVLNGLDILGRWNQEAAPGGLPLLLIVIPAFLPILFRIHRTLQMLLILGAGHSLLFALYFHYGGESYRGRYLTEVAFVLPLLIGALVDQARLRRDGRVDWLADTRSFLVRAMPAAVAVAVVSAIGLNVRADYFNPYLEPVRTVAGSANVPPTDSLIVARHHPEIAPATGKSYRDEFVRAKEVHFSQAQITRYINAGPGTLVATATSIGPDGFPRDARGNVLVGPIDIRQLQQWARHFGSQQVFELRYRSAGALPGGQPASGGRRVYQPWEPARIQVERVYPR